MRFLYRASVLALLLGVAGAAHSHDIWLYAENFKLAKGEELIIHQLLAAELDVDLVQPKSSLELPLLSDITPRFTLVTRQGSFDLLAELPDARTGPEVKPVLERKLDLDGLALIAMDHAILHTKFENSAFLRYLEHEGFDPEDFQTQMGSRSEQSEGYMRTLKTLVRVGKPAQSASDVDVHRRPIGQKIEIVLLQNPYELDPGARLDAQVLFEGEPLRGKLVKAFNSSGEGPISKHEARTDENGIASFTLERGGLWLIRLVHLLPCTERSEVDCDDSAWESYWTSYSFELD